MTTKQQILEALQSWVAQRPGLDFGNYGDMASYRSELRSIAKDKHDAEKLLTAVALRDSITADDLKAAFRAYSGRLSITEENDQVKLSYVTGQYWPTEYRKAACAVLASALWEHRRDSVPSKVEKPGDWIRGSFRREFGRSIQQRWFD